MQKPKKASARSPVSHDVERALDETLAWMKRTGTKQNRDGMARYGIVAKSAFGIPVSSLHGQAKKLGKNHELALALWKTGHYEARMLAVFIDDAARCTPSQMDEWCRDFDNWAICDTACFHLFDRTSNAFAKVKAWDREKGEFQKRASYALLASLSVHDKQASNGAFEQGLASIEKAARDERNFVKKAVNWALRCIGKRNPDLHEQAVALATRLAKSSDATERWVGKDALRDLAKPQVAKRFARQKERAVSRAKEPGITSKTPARRAAARVGRASRAGARRTTRAG